MKKLLVVLACVCAGALFGMPKGFIDDFEAAKEKAADDGKKILAVFSGSDWCIWCQRLEQEVFAHKEFLDAAVKDYVLLYLDSPQDEDLVSGKVLEQNRKLVAKYGVRGFPTVLVLSAKGDVEGKTGYKAGGPKKYVKHLKGLAKSQELMDKYILTYEKKFREIGAGIRKELEAEMSKAKNAPTANREDVFRNAAAKVVPKYEKKLQAVVDEVNAVKVPEEISEEMAQFKQSLEQMMKWIKSLKEKK